MADVGPGRYKLFTEAQLTDEAGKKVLDLLPDGVALRGVFKTSKGDLAVLIPASRERLADKREVRRMKRSTPRSAVRVGPFRWPRSNAEGPAGLLRRLNGHLR